MADEIGKQVAEIARREIGAHPKLADRYVVIRSDVVRGREELSTDKEKMVLTPTYHVFKVSSVSGCDVYSRDIQCWRLLKRRCHTPKSLTEIFEVNTTVPRFVGSKSQAIFSIARSISQWLLSKGCLYRQFQVRRRSA